MPMHLFIGHYNGILLLLAVVVSILSCYTGVDIYFRLYSKKELNKPIWMGIGAIVIGVGIWTTHFLAMMAMDSYDIYYYWEYVLLSLVVSIAAAWITLYLCIKAGDRGDIKLLAGLWTGVGVVLVHYLAMEAVKGDVIYSPGYTGVSVLIPLLGCAILYLWIHKMTLSKEAPTSFRLKVAAGSLLALIVLVMHFTAMAGTSIEASMHPGTKGSTVFLSLALGTFTTLILFIFIFSFFISDRFQIQRVKLDAIKQDYESSEERYSHLVNVTPSAVIVIQQEKIVMANPSAIKGLGAEKAEDLLHCQIGQFIHMVDNERFRQFMDELRLTSQKTTCYQFTICTLDKRELLIEGTFTSVDFEGKKAFMVIGRDITERTRLQKKFMENKQRYKSLFEYNADAVYSLDEKGVFTSVNNACETLSGYTRDELLKHSFKELVCEENLEDCIDLFRGTMQGNPLKAEVAIINKNREKIYLHVTSLPIIVDKKIVGVYGIAKDITEQRKASKLIKQLAFHDYLTGLPNRNMLETKIEEAIGKSREANGSFSLFCMDLDRFKVINDTMGHQVGDKLLKEVTVRIKSCLTEKDVIFRPGGDEFIILFDSGSRESSLHLAEKLIEEITAPFKIQEYDIFTSPSIGISLFPEDGDAFETLMKHAEFAMYQAKKAGKSTYRFYSSLENEKLYNPLKLEMDLHKALEKKELILHYQPKINLKTGKVEGVEALIRWMHPVLDMIPPNHFIPIAEETGLILPIGKWTMIEACRANKKWHDQGFTDLVVSVNLSARQFSQLSIIQTVKEALDASGLPAQFLELEITESMTTDIERAIFILKELKKLGILISIDDFGTGFSSLNYLKEFPVDTLKIDKSFIHDLRVNPRNETIVKTMISMAHNLNLNVVAEGVESIDELMFLQNNLCDSGQGFLFSRPLPGDEWLIKVEEMKQIVTEYGISQDVNNRMWYEESLRMARQELQETVRLQQGMTFKIRKVSGKFIHTLADGELLYKLGLTPERVIGKELIEFAPEEIAIRKTKYYERAWNGEENVAYEGEMQGVVYFAALSPLRRNGEIKEVIASCVDITQKKLFEKALMDSEERYRLIAENMTDLITLVDDKGEIFYASPSHQNVLGIMPSEITGQGVWDYIHPDDLESVAASFKEIFHKRATVQAEYRSYHADGHWILIEATGTPIMDEAGRIRNVVIVSRDITAKREAEMLLWKSEKLSVVGELAAGVAHEIRNPITSIKGFVQLFQRGMVKDEYFDVILAEFNRLEEIIKEFLTLAKPQAIEWKETNMHQLIRNMAAFIESEALLNQVEIVLMENAENPLVICDQNQIKQVFINLAKNSMEAMPNGGLLTISTLQEREELVIRIQDNGLGISQERIDRLGEPFYSNKEKGTGLGLMVSFRIIKEHKGAIHISSEEGKGTIVEIRLPVCENMPMIS
ncbi:PAS domain S-box-containing protein/diguanylate cyclase (GGDEF)-like protein [Falsibacillus pallidus]|uniref:histidine kinase n=2 Tax=Falsibacillus pallidus TaxID=493781 RepID=A0A370GAZ5_9BACI|nr:PAS domain S-box-containing protein/diguanylate cyclase (GGDEF)-like protein [Falsibacillus pallidus]